MATPADYARIGNYARMYNPDQNIDRHTCSRVVPMEVLSLGFSRTGTLSMQSALATLGYANPYHYSSFYDNVQDCDMWLEAFDAKYNGQGVFGKEQFDQLLGHCGAVTDAPANNFAPELIEFYPDAKVVLVERDIEKWYESWSSLLDEIYVPLFYLVGGLDPDFLGRMNRVGYMSMNVQLGGPRDLVSAKARSREAYRRHYAFIRSITPRDRLLEYKLGSGWEPLCEFLGKPVPDVEFPRINEKASMQLTFKEVVRKSLRNVVRNTLKNALVVTAVVGVPLFAWSRGRWVSRR